MGISGPWGGARIGIAAGAVAIAAALAGCGTGSTPPAATSTTAATGTQQVSRVYQQFTQCARAHGTPDFPDPSLQHGTGFGVVFGVGGSTPQGQAIKAEVTRVLGACGSILHELPASVLTPPPTAADLRQMRLYAQCVRQHGVAGFPGPTADGTFPLSGTPLGQQGATPQMKSAFRACAQYHWNFDGGSVDRS